MKAILESLLVPEGANWTYFHRRLKDGIPFNWHYHREFELTLTFNSQGQRYVGDTIESYDDADLVLLGSNLCHAWMSQRKIDEAQPHIAHVFWMRGEWLEMLMDTIVELRPLKIILQRSTQGIVFSAATARAVRAVVERLDSSSPAGRVIRLIEILSILAEDEKFRLLCTPTSSSDGLSPSDRPRIDRALDYIHQNYQFDISINDLANLAALSLSGFHRLFKRHTRQTVVEYVAQLRIGKACSLLISTDRPISWVAQQAGYSNISHFNRQFLTIKETTPREFRRSFLQRDSISSLAFNVNPFASSTKENRMVFDSALAQA